MKLAKAEEKEFDKVYDFIIAMDNLFDSRFFSHEEDWRDWNDDDEDGIIEHVAHVEHTGHIGGRDYDGIGLTSIGFRTEQFVVQPILIPFGLHLRGIVLTC